MSNAGGPVDQKSIAWCSCGNLSLDGINFKRLEDGGLECAKCGASSPAMEFLQVEDLREA
jgi:hypothetical protein